MLRDNLVELIEPMLISAGADPLPLCIHNQPQASDDRLPCLENPRPAGAEPSLTENATSPFQAEPAQNAFDTHAFIEKVDAATTGRFQITTDGFPPYVDAIHTS